MRLVIGALDNCLSMPDSLILTRRDGAAESFYIFNFQLNMILTLLPTSVIVLNR